MMAFNYATVGGNLFTFINKITYDMNKSRIGTDGTGDCSGMISRALQMSGSGGGVFSTVTLGAELQQLGYSRVYAGKTSGATAIKEHDIILMTSATSMAGSGGAGGHVGIIHNGVFLHCTATRWSDGALYVKNEGIQQSPWNSYIGVTRLTTYTEIWRYNYSGTTTGTATTGSKLATDGLLGLASWNSMQKSAGMSTDNVISGQSSNNKGILQAITVSVEWQAPASAKGSLTVAKWQRHMGINPDGIIGGDFVGALQTLLKNKGYYKGAIDRRLDYVSTTVIALQKMLNDGYKF